MSDPTISPRLWISLLLTLFLSACISETNQGPLSEGQMLSGTDIISEDAGDTTAGTSDDSNEGGIDSNLAGDEITQGGDNNIAGVERGGEESVSGTDIAGVDAGNMNVEPDPPLPPEEAVPCERFCQRIEDCLYPRCPALQQIPPEQFCQNWCNNTGDDWLNQGANLSCDDFTRRIYGFSPELGTLCMSDPTVDRCESVCEFGLICGLVSDNCLNNCNSASDQAQLCFLSAADAGDCRRFAQCYQQGPQNDPEEAYEEVCTSLCERESQCLFDACAPGTINSADTEICIDSCILERASQEELYQRYQRTCEEVVNDRLMGDSAFTAQCNTPEEDVCSRLCTNTVTGCGMTTQDECETLCASWDDANFYCLSSATTCDETNSCLVDENIQDRCRRSCDRLQLCLEEACPPRIIPPMLTDRCTADCFEDPVSEEDLADWEMTECREVRNVVYQDNPQLRPICEGNQDFRPSPAECSAFCESGLDQCIIGNRTICLSACASLTRPQYECALAANGECMAIDVCLSE